MNNSKLHQEFLDDILFAVGSLPNVRVWPRFVGLVRAYDSYEKIFRVGIVGESDIDGIIAPSGRKIGIEIKTGSGKLSKEQIKYRDMIKKFGGVHIEARLIDGDTKPFAASIHQVLDELKKYL